jgi:glutamine cyclotransferase
MSTDFVPNKKISFSEIKTFNYNGVTVDTIDGEENIILTDGTSYMWAYPKSEIAVYKASNNNLEMTSHYPYEGVIFTLYGKNDPTKIIEAVEDFFNIRLISEYEDEYGGIV